MRVPRWTRESPAFYERLALVHQRPDLAGEDDPESTVSVPAAPLAAEPPACLSGHYDLGRAASEITAAIGGAQVTSAE